MNSRRTTSSCDGADGGGLADGVLGMFQSFVVVDDDAASMVAPPSGAGIGEIRRTRLKVRLAAPASAARPCAPSSSHAQSDVDDDSAGPRHPHGRFCGVRCSS
jgi:hypothetical protein